MTARLPALPALARKQRRTEKIFAEVRMLLEERRLLLKSGTIIDATIIKARTSNKNEGNARDPEMPQTKKRPMVFWDEGAHWREQATLGA